MTIVRIPLILTFLLLSLSSLSKSLDDQKIQFLLNRVANSKATFLRNGDEHSAKEAKEHLKFKMNQARKMFWFFGPKSKMSVDTFINKIAAQSSTTGKVYKMKLSDGKVIETKKWLTEELKKFSSTPSK